MCESHQLIAASSAASAPVTSPDRSRRATRVATVPGWCWMESTVPSTSAAFLKFPVRAAAWANTSCAATEPPLVFSFCSCKKNANLSARSGTIFRGIGYKKGSLREGFAQRRRLGQHQRRSYRAALGLVLLFLQLSKRKCQEKLKARLPVPGKESKNADQDQARRPGGTGYKKRSVLRFRLRWVNPSSRKIA